MNILIIGERYAQNLGDPVICETVAEAITSKYPQSNIIYFDISGRINYDEQYVRTNNEYSFKDKLFFKINDKISNFLKIFVKYRMYKGIDEYRFLQSKYLLKNILKQHKIDIAIFAGGQLFMDHFIPMINESVSILAKKKVKIIFHACGFGPISKDGEILLKRSLKNKYVKDISVRDSIEYLKKKLNCIKITDTTDTALACSNFFNFNYSQQIPIGVGIIGLYEYKDFQKLLIKYLLDKNINFKLFTNGRCQDEEMAYTLLNELNIKSDNYILTKPINTKTLICNILQFESIISFRLHSLIIAASYGLKHYGFVWDNKVQDMFIKMNRADFCDYPSSNNVFFDNIINKLNNDNSYKIKKKASQLADQSIENLYYQINLCLKEKK